MQLMTFNSLLMFDIVFVFFLFLVGVTCLVYYLPPSKHSTSNNHLRHAYKLVGDCNDGIEINLSRYKDSTTSTAAFEMEVSNDSSYKRQSQSKRIAQHHECESSDVEQSPQHKFIGNSTNIRSNKCVQTVDTQFDVIDEKINSLPLPTHHLAATTKNPPSFCYIKAKYREIKNITGPIQSV